MARARGPQNGITRLDDDVDDSEIDSDTLSTIEQEDEKREARDLAAAQNEQATMQQVLQQLAATNQALLTSQQQMLLRQPMRKVHYHELKPRTAFNPTGQRDGRTLRRRCYQNGVPLFANRLSTDEIALLNQVTPGTYCGGRVSIFERNTGSSTDLHIVYSNGDINQVLANKSHFRDLHELLQKAVSAGLGSPGAGASARFSA